MSKHTGMDMAEQAKKHGATVSDWGRNDIKIADPKSLTAVVVPRGEMRPSLWGFASRVLRVLGLMVFLLGGYAVAIRLP